MEIKCYTEFGKCTWVQSYQNIISYLIRYMAYIYLTSTKMNVLLYFALTNIFKLWIGVASQCADSMLFKLSEIRAEIANVTQYCNEQNQLIATLNEEIADLKGKLARFEEDVSFSATLGSPPPGYTVINDNATVFPNIKENKGSGYDSSTGILSAFTLNKILVGVGQKFVEVGQDWSTLDSYRKKTGSKNN